MDEKFRLQIMSIRLTVFITNAFKFVCFSAPERFHGDQNNFRLMNIIR